MTGREKPTASLTPDEASKAIANIIVGVLFLVFLAYWGLGGCDRKERSPRSKGSTTAPERDNWRHRRRIWFAAQDAIKARLKAPSEAEFPTFRDSFLRESGGDYIVTAYVDAPNSFNAKLRKRFVCTVGQDYRVTAVFFD